ncbi:MAG: cysteine desulfurase family protein [Chloroflexi bacterium]|nr:cysteine desulfurase family protein [Chloroflexota bacterium]
MDHAATTPVAPEVIDAMRPFFEDQFGNASSIYSLGQTSRRAIDDARGRCAKVLGARAGEIVFTSGGTESDNAALMGAALALRERGNHIVTTAIEHHAVLHAAELLASLGFDVTYVAPGREGIVTVEAIEAAVTPSTTVVSVMLANNETGAIQPVAEIARAVKARAASEKRIIAVHTDAVQAAGFLDLNVGELGVDLLSLSAHKFNGPKGVGLLYIRRGTPFRPTQVGGAQEHDRRAGTENTPAIVGMGLALENADRRRLEAAATCQALSNRLIAGITERVERASLNGDPERRLPNNVNFTFAGVEAEPLLMGLDLAGIAASSGSACTAASIEPSHVLLAMGHSDLEARSTLRLTVGPENTEDEVDYVVDTVAVLIPKLRKLASPSRR